MSTALAIKISVMIELLTVPQGGNGGRELTLIKLAMKQTLAIFNKFFLSDMQCVGQNTSSPEIHVTSSISATDMETAPVDAGVFLCS